MVTYHSMVVVIIIRLLLMRMLLGQCRFFCGCYSSSGSAFQLRQYTDKVIPTMRLTNQIRQRPVQQWFHYSTKKKRSIPLRSSINNQNSYDSDTIYALSSGGGGSVATAIAVIRISGPQSFVVLDQLMNYPQQGRGERKRKQQMIPKARYASVRNLYDPRDGSTLDQALVLTFPRPHSFTGENVVELHCHGSRGVIQGVLDALAALAMPRTTSTTTLSSVPVRPSERGEFTQRAFENGKLNLLQVEALADLILSDTSLQRKQALRNLIGDNLSRLYNQWRKDLIKGLAHAEAIIDFGDDEDLSATASSSTLYDDDEEEEDNQNNNAQESSFKTQSSVWGGVQHSVSQLRTAMERHIQDNQRGEIIRQGVRVAIIGPVNAGKSSLLNILAKRDAAIVSPIAGTTRDIVEVIMDLGGVRCIVSDTAGIRDTTEDLIEQEGIRRAKVAAKDAHVCVIVIDASDSTSVTSIPNLINSISAPEIERVDGSASTTMTTTSRQPILLLVSNKIDKIRTIDASYSTAFANHAFPQLLRYNVSCTTGDGVDEFLNALTSIVFQRVGGDNDLRRNKEGRGEADEDIDDDASTVITRARHRYHVQKAIEALQRFDERSQQGLMSADLAAEELRLAASELGRIVGAIDVEDVLDVLFTDFCIGK